MGIIPILAELTWNWYCEACASRRPKPKVLEEQGGLAAVSGSPDKNADFIWKWNKANGLGDGRKKQHISVP